MSTPAQTIEHNGRTYILVRPCDQCVKGTVDGTNGSYWRCSYCDGTGSYYKPVREEPKS